MNGINELMVEIIIKLKLEHVELKNKTDAHYQEKYQFINKNHINYISVTNTISLF